VQALLRWLCQCSNGPKGHSNEQTEAEIYRAYGVSKGIPEERIVIETRATVSTRT